MQYEANPEQFGWQKDKTQRLVPVMMSQSPAVPEVLNDVVCECADACSDICKCSKYGQACTAARSCRPFEDSEPGAECQNPLKITLHEDSSDVSEDEGD